MRKRPRRRRRSPLLRAPGIWLSHHMQGALATLGHLFRSPLPTLMTVAVIGIALALPAGLYVITRNLSLLGSGWEQTAAMSVFLKPDVAVAQAAELAGRLSEREGLAEVRLIAPDEALQELRDQSGFAEAIDQLTENPLPVVLSVRPAAEIASLAELDRVQRELEALPEADFVRADTRWVRRFHAMVHLAQRGVLLLGALLSLAVLLVVGNTIRLEIQNRRSEIQVMELVGATPAFIRRPFLYTGAWYGLLGGVTAWLLVTVALSLLQGPVSRLALLYETQFWLAGLGLAALLGLLGTSVTLGLLGSWLSVGRHLTASDPE